MNKAIAISIFFLSFEVLSQCDFQTGMHVREIDNPLYLNKIEVEVAKSSKYAKNLFKIYSSKSENIPPSLKKKFNANIIVHYKFGTCSFEATIRQSGDWKDHIALKNGQPIRSLDIKLIDGNIMNAVSFKLLIPETRNGLNEVLASLLLRNLGFITPETFEIDVSVNGVNSVMLFQEKSAKELLERNLKREGPIYEGDESMLWSYQDFEINELEPISLSRLVNNNWFEKGQSSMAIVIESIGILQNAYLKFGYKNQNNKSQYSVFPNITPREKTINYHAALVAMNGQHGLRPHNRKIYYNSLDTSLEPIYYDGGINFLNPIEIKEIEKYDSLINILPRKPKVEFIQLSESVNNNRILKDNFLNRVLDPYEAEKFFDLAIEQFIKNLKFLDLVIAQHESFSYSKKAQGTTNYYWYEDFMNQKGIEQKIATNINFMDQDFIVDFKGGETLRVTTKDISRILSRNNLKNNRVVFIPPIEGKNDYIDYQSIQLQKSIIKISKGMDINISKEKKTLYFNQSNPLDWALISGGDLSSWDIIFNGIEYNNLDPQKQRFNKYGLTGCLTIYEAKIDETSFIVNDGGCEDSINIINSIGKNIDLYIRNAQADALDADFSELIFANLDIENAANDCFDVSGGKYIIIQGVLKKCSDKALSVGEKSTLNIKNITIDEANIAIAVKDLSEVLISTMQAKNINLCAQVKRKKQEFGGARLEISNHSCLANIDVDLESVLIVNKL
ncbi:hypothetical protein N9N99_01030 [Gammaproteobacteria bacterium]|nr:hypothetical protein [Gammaproteobacteria bacterium]